MTSVSTHPSILSFDNANFGTIRAIEIDGETGLLPGVSWHRRRPHERHRKLVAVRHVWRNREDQAPHGTGSGFSARGLLAFAEDSLRDHLAAVCGPGGTK